MDLKKSVFAVVNHLPSPVLSAIRRSRLESAWYFNYFRLSGKNPMPVAICVDTSTVCQLKCPLCPTGVGGLGKKSGLMSLETFEAIIEGLPSVKRIGLFNWGEPLLNPRIIDIIRHASSSGVFTMIHTNLSLKKDDSFFEELVDSGLNRLSLSIDGASSETYSRYRVGGDFDLVLANLRSLVRIRRDMGRRNPHIVWQFIVHRHNIGELQSARSMATEMGVEFHPIKMGMGDSLPDFDFPASLETRMADWLPEDEEMIDERYLSERSSSAYASYCEKLFMQPVIAPDGKVYPCCKSTNEGSAFGDINEQPFAEIWNNEKFTSARRLFTQEERHPEHVKTLCDTCPAYTKKAKRAKWTV